MTAEAANTASLEATLQKLLQTLRDQGSLVPPRLLDALRARCAIATDDPQADVAEAELRVLLAEAGWLLRAGVPRWDIAADQEDADTPWGSLWLGQPVGLGAPWQLWQRSAQEGWQALPLPVGPKDATALVMEAAPGPGARGWLLTPEALPDGSGQTSTYWTWVVALLRGRLGGILVASMLVNMGLIVLPLFAMLVYDKVVYNGVFETLWALAIGVLAFVAMELLVRQLRARQVERLALVLDERVDRQLFSRLLQPTGRGGSQPGMAARFLSLYRDLSGARDFFSANYLMALADLPFVVLIWVVIGVIAWPLLLVGVVWTVIYVWLGGRIKQRTLELSQVATRTQMAKQAVLTDAMSSLDVLRTSHAGGKLFQRFMRLASAQALQNASLRNEGLRQAYLTQVVYTGNFVSLIVVGAYLVFDQTITTGALVAVSMLSGRTLSSVSLALQTMGRWNELQQALTALTPYLKEQADASTSATRRAPAEVQGRVALVQVAHRYGDGAAVLREINLAIAPGERVGLLGRPGSGKSTLSRVLAGAMMPSGGEVRVDDMALLDYDAADRAQWLAFKPQEPTLVAGTVEDNILLGLPEWLGQSERMAALKRGVYFSGLDQDLQRATLSLSQPVEEYGSNLSGGQRQKVALARALAQNARVVLLDEPTNGLDPESERLLVARLAELTGVTLLLVTHSSRMLALTQRVIVLEQGRLVADGETTALVKPTN
ncbi:ATP-binding cassette domain-containing protein [Rhodoferax sp.]|jgi:ABC-type bacteriocin/lantibiotic exporter with double-glycine peptidase domain|uniref:ATP-binding cassette domain-containing protein n=1 Tax=Rhodoferax sp. TaxID=50421 RepID=UPI0037846A3C